MRTKEEIRNKEICARCDRRGSISCTHCHFNAELRGEIMQAICKALQEKISEDPVVAEHKRMTKYLRDKYGENS